MSIVADYEAFLASKRVVSEPVGFEIDRDSLHPSLFEFQKDIVLWSLKRGRAATFCDCGLGKTRIQLEWSRHVVRHTGGDVLILAPLAVAAQTSREGEKIGVTVTVCRDQSDVRPGINITNYERLHLFAPDFAGIVLDECFAPGTEVDTPSGRKHIENVKIGDKIINASGVDTVADIHRREVPYAVRLTINGQTILSSPNHPYFTRRGWVGAQDIIPGDEVMATAASVRMVRQDVHGEVRASREDAILRAILLSEMADEPARAQGEGAYAGSGEEARREASCMAGIGVAAGASGNRAHPATESHAESGIACQSLPHIEIDPPRTFRAWGQWAGPHGTATDDAGHTWRGMDAGVCLVTGPANSRLSHALQDRLGGCRAQNRYRVGWELPSQPKGARREEGRETRFTRVDRLEILEPGHPELDRLRDADGKLYFYDLGATRHPSFSINGILVHNSSILKSFDGSTRKQISSFASDIHYRLACTATPAPNDLIELTNHAEFLDVMGGKEIIALFFTQDGNTTHKWRLKGHAKEDFWKWMASWSVAIRKPSDMGYPDDGFDLPPMTMHQHVVDAEANTGTLFPMEALTLQERQRARRESIIDRVDECKNIVEESWANREQSIGANTTLPTGSVDSKTSDGHTTPEDMTPLQNTLRDTREQWVIWVDLNAEQRALEEAFGDFAFSIYGSLSPEEKEGRLTRWLAGERPILISKPSVCGFGVNMQNCAHMAFVGLSDSYEQQYQAIRRCWRFGQTRPVEVHVITAETEGAVVANIQRKERQAEHMMESIVKHMNHELGITSQQRDEMTYREDTATGPDWTLMLGDSVKRMREIPDNSIGLGVHSPPFPGMYAYTNSPHDMGNVTSLEEMIEQYTFLIPELLRVTMPGRSTAVHLTQAVAFKGTDGYVGIKDFRGAVIRAYEQAGWIYYGEVTIDKNPQLKAIRTKDRGLLFKTLANDSSHMHMALADYLLQFRKPGENPIPIRAGISEKYHNPHGWITQEEWIEWAAPVWYRADMGIPGGIRETDVLNVQQARETDDERHLAPLQLGVIERAIKLWSAPGDTVLSPFAGIGSEGYMALKLHRKFIGCELKESYWRSAITNLNRAIQERSQGMLFDLAEVS